MKRHRKVTKTSGNGKPLVVVSACRYRVRLKDVGIMGYSKFAEGAEGIVEYYSDRMESTEHFYIDMLKDKDWILYKDVRGKLESVPEITEAEPEELADATN